MGDIKSEPSPLFLFWFRYYVKLLFYRRFDRVWLNQNYLPGKDRSTIYFLNHNSWWDGIIPLLLNEFHFRQHAGAIMDEEQIRKHPFFRKLGAYPIDRSTPGKAVKSLQFTVDFLNQKGKSVFIYPQGKLVDSNEPVIFESGLSWLSKHCEGVDFVPVALHQHTYYSDKPSLFIKTGKPVVIDLSLPKIARNRLFEQTLIDLLTQIRNESFKQDHDYERIV